jgi:hypothetical protein
VLDLRRTRAPSSVDSTTSDASSPHRLASEFQHPVPHRPGARFYLLSTWLALTVSDRTVSQSHAADVRRVTLLDRCRSRSGAQDTLPSPAVSRKSCAGRQKRGGIPCASSAPFLHLKGSQI